MFRQLQPQQWLQMYRSWRRKWESGNMTHKCYGNQECESFFVPHETQKCQEVLLRDESEISSLCSSISRVIQINQPAISLYFYYTLTINSGTKDWLWWKAISEILSVHLNWKAVCVLWLYWYNLLTICLIIITNWTFITFSVINQHKLVHNFWVNNAKLYIYAYIYKYSVSICIQPPLVKAFPIYILLQLKQKVCWGIICGYNFFKSCHRFSIGFRSRLWVIQPVYAAV